MVTDSGVSLFCVSSLDWLLLGEEVFSEESPPFCAEQAIRLRAITPARARESIFFMFIFGYSFSEKY